MFCFCFFLCSCSRFCFLFCFCFLLLFLYVVLIFKGNTIGDKGISSLAEALKKNTSVQTIRLSSNSFAPRFWSFVLFRYVVSTIVCFLFHFVQSFPFHISLLFFVCWLSLSSILLTFEFLSFQLTSLSFVIFFSFFFFFLFYSFFILFNLFFVDLFPALTLLYPWDVLL